MNSLQRIKAWLSGENQFQKAAKGAVLSTSFHLTRQLWALFSNLLLTRLLLPEAFGLMATIFVIITAFTLLSDMGMDVGIVRSERGDDPDFINTVWTLQVLRHALIFFACLGCTGWVAEFYNEPFLAKALPVSALGLFLSGFRSMAWASGERNFNLKPGLGLDLKTQALFTIIAATWAFIDPTPWALVGAAFITEGIYKPIASHRLSTAIPCRFKWDSAALHEILHLGKWIFLSTTLYFIATQFDRIILPRWFDMTTMGIYHIASTFSQMPGQIIGGIASSVLLPLFSKFSRESDNQVCNNDLLKVRSAILPATMALIVALHLGAELLFQVLYNDAYAEGATMLMYLSVMVWFSCLKRTIENMSIAIGKTYILALNSMVSLIFRVGSSWLGYLYNDLYGLLLGLVVGTALEYLAIQLNLRRYGIKIFTQDLCYTFALAIVLAIFHAGQGTYQHWVWEWIWPISLCLTTCAVLAWMFVKRMHAAKQVG